MALVNRFECVYVSFSPHLNVKRKWIYTLCTFPFNVSNTKTTKSKMKQTSDEDEASESSYLSVTKNKPKFKMSQFVRIETSPSGIQNVFGGTDEISERMGGLRIDDMTSRDFSTDNYARYLEHEILLKDKVQIDVYRRVICGNNHLFRNKVRYIRLNIRHSVNINSVNNHFSIFRLC